MDPQQLALIESVSSFRRIGLQGLCSATWCTHHSTPDPGLLLSMTRRLGLAWMGLCAITCKAHSISVQSYMEDCSSHNPILYFQSLDGPGTVIFCQICEHFLKKKKKRGSQASVAHLMFCNVINQSHLIHWASSMKTRISFLALIHCQDPSTSIMG